jgi:peptidyl-prolyl cis-trans isomerase C
VSRMHARRSAWFLDLLRASGLTAALLLGTGEGAASAPPARSSGSADDPVAIVNGQAIQAGDYDLAVQLQFSARRRTGTVGLQELRSVREAVFQRLIDNELLYQKAAKASAGVSESDVESQVKSMQEHLGGPEELAHVLQESQVTEARFRDQVRRTLMVTRFVEKEVTNAVKVADDEVKLYYEQNPKEFTHAERAHVSQIMVRVPPGATAKARTDARTRIEEILKSIRAGESFESVARKHSEGPEASRGGDTGLVTRGGKVPPPIERAVFSLRPGEMSDIIETRLGYHIILVTERFPEGVTPFEEAQRSIRAKLMAHARHEALAAYLAGLREKARIERRLPPPPAEK